MIKSLRKRPRPDQLVNQQRRATNRTGRLVYLGLLGALAITIANRLEPRHDDPILPWTPLFQVRPSGHSSE